MILHAPLILFVLARLGVVLADPFLSEPPPVAWTAPDRAPDIVGRASTYGRAKDSRRQSLMASAPHVRISGTMHVCASRTLKFGTLLVLQSARTGRVTACKVTDRGPYGKRDAVTGEWFNSAREPERDGVHRGDLDLSPAVRADLGPGDGGLHPVRAWIAYTPRRPVRLRVRRPSS